MGLELEHIETPEFAERVTAVRDKAQAEAQEHAQQERANREAERAAEQEKQQAEDIARQKEAIAEAHARLDDMKTNLPERLAALKEACDVFSREREALIERAGRSRTVTRAWGSNACRNNFSDRMQRQLDRVEEGVNEMEVREDRSMAPPMPYLGNLDPDWMAKELDSLETQIEELRDA